jgi:hypothetical protein
MIIVELLLSKIKEKRKEGTCLHIIVVSALQFE